MNNGLPVDVIDGGQDAIFKLLFGSHPDMAQHGARELGEEAFDEVQPRAMLRGEGQFEATLWLCREPGFCFLGDVGGMIVEDQLDRGRSRIGRIEKL